MFLCGSSWGIGGYRVFNEETREWEWQYGLYKPQNPHDFSPDYENCTKEEISNWMRDLEAWDLPRHEKGECEGACVICRGEARPRENNGQGS